MTLEQILADIRSDRKKKVIIDSDTYNECDDQYAVAYTLGSERIETLGINAVLFNNSRSEGYADGVRKSYEEILRVLEVCGKSGQIPAYMGCETTVTLTENFAPTTSPAVENLIKTAMEADEMIYVLSMGALTNVACALLIEPAIKDKICVIWLGLNCISWENMEEFNLVQDYAAGQIVMNSGVNFVILPAMGHGEEGTKELYTGLNTIRRLIVGDSKAAVFFRETLPGEFMHEAYGGVWERIIWDIAAPAVLSVPEAFEFSIIPAPVITNDKKLAFDSTRHKVIYMDHLDAGKVFKDAFGSISRL